MLKLNNLTMIIKIKLVNGFFYSDYRMKCGVWFDEIA